MEDPKFTNTGWPYEKKLHERIKELEAELVTAREAMQAAHQSLKWSEEYDGKLLKERDQLKADVETLIRQAETFDVIGRDEAYAEIANLSAAIQEGIDNCCKHTEEREALEEELSGYEKQIKEMRLRNDADLKLMTDVIEERDELKLLAESYRATLLEISKLYKGENPGIPTYAANLARQALEKK